MGFFVQYAAQTTGAMVVYGEYCCHSILGCELTTLSVYVVQLYKNLGESGGIPLVLGAAYVTVAALSNFIGSMILDRVGRIPLLGVQSPSFDIQGKEMLTTLHSHWSNRLHAIIDLGDCDGRAICRHL